MKEFEMKKALQVAGFDLKNNKKLLLGWNIAIFGFVFLYMILFPSIQDIGLAKMEMMPQGLLELVGMSSMSEITNYVSYFGMIYNLILIAVSIFSVTFVTGLFYKEEKLKTIEFTNSLCISRIEIYVGKLLAAFAGVLSVCVVAMISTLVCGAIGGGETFDVINILQIIKFSSFSAFFFLGVGAFLAGVTTKFSVATVGSILVFACYLLGYLGIMLQTKAEWLTYLSPFEMFNPKKVLVMSQQTVVTLVIYGIILLLLVIGGAVCYKKRDFNI